jgi:hypothetical protein
MSKTRSPPITKRAAITRWGMPAMCRTGMVGAEASSASTELSWIAGCIAAVPAEMPVTDPR